MGDFMKLSIFVASIAFLFVATSAEAVPVLPMTGAQFFKRCTNPPPDQGTQVVALCEIYVAGIADGLQTSGRACIGPGVMRTQLFPYTLAWIQNHMLYGNNSAYLMIAHGLEYQFPCGMAGLQQRRAPTTAQQVQQFERIVEFMKTAKTLLALLGIP
jgi:hypothetical protein